MVSVTNPKTNIYPSADSNAYESRIKGDAFPRLVIDADGKHHWGDGTKVGPLELYRSSDYLLESNGTIQALGLRANSNLITSSNGSTIIPLTVKGAAGQTADLQQWQNSAGNVISRISSLGRMYVDTPNTGFEVRNGGSSKVGLDVRGIIYFDPNNEQTTIGAAGTASALPSAPTKYLRVVDSAGNILAIPAYASA